MRATVLTVIVSALCMSATVVSAQCLLRPVELNQRIDESSTIVEGRVTGKTSYWNVARNLIYTAYTIDVYKIFKGNAAQTTVEIIAEGGIVGNDMHLYEPGFILHQGEVGIFMLEQTVYEKNPASIIPASATYRAYALLQGFVKYNEQERTATDVFNQYDNIPIQLYDKIVQRTGQSFHIIKPYSIFESSQRGNSPEAAPVISNFSPTTISAGTKSILTINGSNFGASMGTSTVLFKDANDGGATYYITPSTEIITWTDNQITVYVPTRAGTGTIQVNVPGEGTGTSVQTLTVTFSNLNVTFSGQWPTRMISDNGNGGYTYNYFTDFAANTSAREAFERAFVNWRCNTFVNWQIGSTTATNTHASDGINVVRFDIGSELPGGVLGQAGNYYSSCDGINWHQTEIDLRFDDGTNWYYGTGSPGGAQFDFESVALHELGHGHQLGHVIEPGAVMHYALTNGTHNRILSANDLAGGNTVMNRSTSNPFCGQPLMIALTAGTCQLHSVGDYRSKQTGLWDAASSWERFDGTNWVNAVAYPTHTDGVITIRNGHNITATAGQFTADELVVDVGGTFTVENIIPFALNDGPGDDLIVHGTIIWNNMQLSGPGNMVISSTGTLNIISTGFTVLTAVLTNNGTINWNNFDLNNSSSSNIINNGIFNINTNNDLQGFPVTNNGTVNKNSSGLARMLNGTCNNSGTWNLNDGTFEAPVFSNTGVLSFSNGAVFRNGGGFNHNSGASIQGTGSFQNNQSLYVNVNMVFPSTVNFTLSPGQNISGDGDLTLNQYFVYEGANISGNGTFTVNGNFEWRDGTLTRLTTIAAPDTLFLTTTATKSLAAQLTNNGTIIWSDGNLGISQPIVNNAYLNITGNNQAGNFGSGAFNNNGTITKYSSGTTTMSVPVNNNATGIIKGTGTFSITQGFTNSGTIEPGLSPGILTFLNPFNNILSSNSTLLIEIAGAAGAGQPTGHDMLFLSYDHHTISINGKLKVVETGSVPVGDYTVLENLAGILNGTFSTLDLPPNYLVLYFNDSVVVRKICVPEVSISADPGNTICDGTNVTFTATPTHGGTPSYQWKLNGNNVGTNSPTYSNAALVNGDVITCVMTSSLSCATPTTATSNAITMTVIPIVVPSVSISANPGNTICEGTNVTFTATPTNGGTTPAYQWKLNGNNVGTNSNTYSNAALVNGDVVTCVLTSNAVCATPTTATSNAITMTVHPILVPSVSIAASPGNNICAGVNVTFTATPTNGGATPAYQWKLNGNNVGTNSNTYSNAALANGDVVTCVLTSSVPCPVPPAATSNAITMTVTPNVTPSVSIAASPGNNVCAGTDVTFTASPTNGGATPAYQWKLNGNNVGTNSPTYSNAALANGDVVTCVLTSSLTCVTSSTGTSNAITMTVTANVTPAVSIAASPGTTVCAGTNVTFTATPTNGGATPSYQWKLNGNNVGTNSNTYSNALLVNGDMVSCEITTSLICVTVTTATSNTITITITSSVTPSISIAASPGTTVCAGSNVTFTATPTNGGVTPSYQWKLNGNNVGTNSNTYSNAALVNGDVVSCVLTSSEPCAVPTTATSNNITMTITPNVAPSVSIAASPGNNICAGTNVTFTATPTNGGATPSYQWKLNGNNVGTNSSTYSNAALVNSDVVTCVLTSSVTCVTSPTATSNAITMTVTANVTPTVSIAASPGTTVCAGTNVTFTATPTNGGATPSYQWKLNGNNVGTNSNTYTNASLISGDMVSCEMTTSLVCVTATTATSNTITITITSSVTPSVSIAASPGTTVCAGTNVLFTATPTNGGVTPSYQWKLNGNNVGTNSTTYSNAALVNGDVVNCVLTSSEPCAVPATATSNDITMTITPNVTPSVSIAASPGNNICAGTNVTFTATPTNGGATPSYQWRLNGNNVGANSNTYSNAALVNGDVVTCELTSSVTCVTSPTATSNSITMNVTANVTPSVSISANPGSTICAGTNVTFTATPTNGGATPSYQWKLNGNNVGTNSNTYSNASLVNGDVVGCVMTSSVTCVTTPTATSNDITITIISSVTPSVSISANPGNTICAGINVTFTATPSNGGATPSYQWRVNGNNVGTNSPTYSSTSLANGDVVTCILTSSESCAVPPTATSNAITMNVTANVTPAISIAASPGNNICAGTNVIFTATPTNGGATPAYQWRLNGNNVGTNNNTYSNAALANSDVVTCVLTSSVTCVTSSTATSNAITMTVTVNVTPAVSIAANPGNNICAGTNVTFTATPTNGGATPAYQWRLNGNNVGTNSPTYSNASLANGDVVTCVLTSSLTCVTISTATSNSITMNVTSNVTPAVSIAASPGNTVCVGTNVTFTATPTNGGATPSYQWRLNGNNVGTNSPTYSNASLVSGDVVTCVLTSSITCVTSTTATSNAVTMTVNALPAISVHPVSQSVFVGTNVTFTVTATGAGLTYQWRKNGVNIPGATASSYTINNVATGDAGNYDVVVSGTCPPSVTSNVAVLTVNAVTITTQPVSQAVCESLNVTFTVVAAGPSLTYQWQLSSGGGPFNNISGATNASLTLTAVTVAMSGNQYRCVISGLLNSNAATLTVNALPVVSLNLPFDTLYKNSPTQHLGGGVPVGGSYSAPGIIGSFHPSAMALGNYTMTYTFTNANGCTSSATDVFTIIPKADKINIYPVPARDGKVTIVVAEELLNGQAVAYNAIGQKMAQWEVKGRLMSFEFPWGGGTYVIEVRKIGVREVRKFTIVR
jgi:hypothetical protein